MHKNQFLCFLFVVGLSYSCGQDLSPTGNETDGDIPWTLHEGSENPSNLTTSTELFSSSDNETSQSSSVFTSPQTETSSAETKEPESSTAFEVSTSTQEEISSTLSPTTLQTSQKPEPSTTTENPTTVENTSTELPPLPVEEGGFSPWLIVFSVLLFFALFLTILSFLRRYMIRRRREDQRKLLRSSSASSEGFFYGDGSGSVHSPRFHDSI